VILRFFNVYGARQGLNDYSGVITRFIDFAKKGTPLTVYGDGSQTRDFVNVEDVAQAVYFAVKSKVNGEIFNIGSGQPTTINELATAILELVGASGSIHHENARAGDIKHSYADISKAKKMLGYEPIIALKDGLRNLLEYNASSLL
jgi:UDP-glucose 4-epimerase